MKYILAPSILDADFSCLREVIHNLEKNKIELIHLDIMDGIFVPNISFGQIIVKTISDLTSIPLSVHLMIEQPDIHINSFVESMDENDCLIVHTEASRHLDRTLQNITEYNIKSGVALNPSTSLESIKYVLDKINTIIIMSVNPGFGGQKFIPSMISKIISTREMVIESGRNINIQVDGGINSENILTVKRAGANILVVGSEIFKSEYPEKMIKKLQGKLSGN